MTENSVVALKFSEVSLQPVEENPDDLNIQCVQSTEFVVGKQNNFNGPVTIINCAEKPGEEAPEGNNQMKEEKIIIRDKVLSQAKPSDQTVDEKNGKSDEGAKNKATKEKQWKRMLKERKYIKILLFVGVGILLVIAIGLGVFFGVSPTEDRLIIGKYSLYPKHVWGGKPPRSTVEMNLPVPYVIISHTVTPPCYSFGACSRHIQSMQEYHFRKNFADISYNFLVDSSGNIYSGRGWSNRNAMGKFVNGRSIDIGLIGDYSEGNDIPTEDLMDGVKALLEYGVANEKISQNYSLVAAGSIYPSLSPGQNVYNIIKTWSHFDPTPELHVKEYDV